MKHAIGILNIEKYRLIDTINSIDKYSVHPAYSPPDCKVFQNKLSEINTAIDVLNKNLKED